MKNYEDVMACIGKIINENVSDEAERVKIHKRMLKLSQDKVNIMIVGGTGVGKSSTINALFDTSDAKVGVGVDPETISIDRYEMGNLVLWDTPGLGHGVNEDKRHRKNIIAKLTETEESSEKLLIDLVLVIVDASNRDMGTSYELINLIIKSYAHKDRIIIALNQCDMAMKGRFWNYKENKPEPQLVDFLEQKVDSIRRRIYESNGIKVDPIYYSAGYTDEVECQKPYNISKLFYLIVKNLKSNKAVIVCTRKTRDDENTRYDEYNNGGRTYKEKTSNVFMDAVKETCEAVWDKVCDVGNTIANVASSAWNTVCSWFW